MIKIVFHRAASLDSWAHEMLINRRWLETLRAHGVPCVGRLAFSGVTRGTLRVCVQDEGTTTFEFAEPNEPPSEIFRATHTAPDHSVFMSGVHLSRVIEQDEAEDLFA